MNCRSKIPTVTFQKYVICLSEFAIFNPTHQKLVVCSAYLLVLYPVLVLYLVRSLCFIPSPRFIPPSPPKVLVLYPVRILYPTPPQSPRFIPSQQSVVCSPYFTLTGSVFQLCLAVCSQLNNNECENIQNGHTGLPKT